MRFHQQIYNYLDTSNILEVGEVKISQAYLYANLNQSRYEIIVHALAKQKIVSMKIQKDRKEVFSATGTVNYVLNAAVGYIRNH